MGTVFTLLSDLFRAVGPGVLLAFALPVLLLLLGVVVLSSYRRVRGD